MRYKIHAESNPNQSKPLKPFGPYCLGLRVAKDILCDTVRRAEGPFPSGKNQPKGLIEQRRTFRFIPHLRPAISLARASGHKNVRRICRITFPIYQGTSSPLFSDVSGKSRRSTNRFSSFDYVNIERVYDCLFKVRNKSKIYS